MDPASYLEALEADTTAFATAARAGLDAAVPSCPEWDVRALLVHLGDVHRWVSEIVSTRAQERIQRDHAPGAGEDPLEWFEAGARTLLDVLRSTPADTEMWNWSEEPRVAAFWQRRMAHETAVHRWDAENAHGQAKPIPAALASDGLDELFCVVVPRIAASRAMNVDGTLHAHCTDVDGEWVVALDDGVATVQREHAKADIALRGPASDVLLAATGRVPLATVDLFGDAALAEQWRAALAFE